MSEILTNSIFSNTIQDWFIALAIIVASVLVGKIIYRVFSHLARRLTAKTKIYPIH